MARFFHESDGDLSVLDGQSIAVVGYGNQGRAQALNLRDSGLAPVVANIEDEAAALAREDGFDVVSLDRATAAHDILLLLLPDEIQREVYNEALATELRPGQTLCFAHGYNIRYGLVEPPETVDVVLVAPRMIGAAVRELYKEGSGAPAFIGVEQDASGRAWPTALGLAHALGFLRRGSIEASFATETELDLFSEQAVWPVISRLLVRSFERLVEEGYDAEPVLLELYASGEPARVMEKMASQGIFEQLDLHSRTSQYGSLSRAARMDPSLLDEVINRAIEDIQSGTFAREWETERERDFPEFERLLEEARSHTINTDEARVREALAKPELDMS